MYQTRLSSFVESMMNVAIGYGVAIASQIVIFPMFGIHVGLKTNLWIGVWFTGVSLIRSYVIRRWFNARLHKLAMKLTEKEVL